MKSILKIVYILTTCSIIILATHQQCTCGNLGEGKNPCSCSEVVVKAAELPKPKYYASPQQINDAAAARYSISVSPSQNGYSDSQSSGSSTAQSNSNLITYTNTQSNGCSESSSSTYSNSNSNTQSSSSTSDSSASIIIYNDAASSPDSTSNGNSGCGCVSKKNQNVEVLEIDDSQSSNGNIVPSFSPIGDLCYPLPVDSRTGKIIEKTTKVIPAYPGKIVCQNCNNPSTPYEVCINSLTGEIISRKILPSSSDTTSKSGTLIYGNSNSALDKSTSNPIALGKSGVISASAFGSFSGSKFGSISGSKAIVYKNINAGAFSGSNSAPYNLPLVYANLNSANRQKQISRMTLSASSSDCFDDTAGGTQVDYSYPTMPADAVSLTLAYKNLRAPNVIYRQGKQFVPEDKLSFGHRTVPNDAKSETKVLDIPEEKLVTVDKPVVELKLAPPKTVVIGSYDEREEARLAELEAIERESITQEENLDHMSESLLTYKDLGYAPVDATYKQSISYNGAINYNGEINDSAEEPCGPLGPPLSDYVPGRVVVHQEVVEDDSDNSNNGEISEYMQIVHSSSSGPCPT